ncbi:inter-alpha-trypsin inhibitor heavy chain H3-like [Acanthochromis polyacanthus]|uniref:inter-alpha-trypsin inhibitor heavy chain H3-like n=1 Tax=Acanthochromis polyacanthus TaxID=80966 RepID=UPI002234187F|nr:inter-alpha-trypsin inhibitor heavy chain H3-like [Acanthochromis polyacanthus]
MERTVVQLTLFGLLLALATTLPNKDDWDIYSFHINSTVTDRYATTVITSRVANRMDESKEIEFHVRIPKNAFISKFRMFIDGQAYDGIVKAKEQAQKQYTEAVSRGQSAGIVSSVGRTLEEFKTSVTVAAHQKVTFELTYEELMKRTLGKYELQIHARPMQPVKDFKIDVLIHEKAGISFINVKGGLSTKALANAITKEQADKQAWVHFYPTEDQQKTCDSCGVDGMNGDLVIVYDVNRDTTLGDIKKSDGYFVHHFAPTGLSRIPKNVVFLIDQSGSMHGRKIEQTRIALIHILNDLAEDDYFGLITFHSGINHWKQELVQASSVNVESAKNFARTIGAAGGTDINQAVLKGASMLNAHPRQGSASILILLTDGDPTSGETNIEVIQSNVRRAIADKFPLYCLGFGFDVNFKFLEKMSLQNNGVARRIYEDSDADLQLKGFYEEVATPLLTDLTLLYAGGTNLTQTNFSMYYNGSEIVVAGQITDNDVETFTPQVVAISGNRRVTFSGTNTSVESTGTESGAHIQRVWAYLTVKQLLEKELQLSGPEKEKVKKDALELSLQYSFVTPLTSMVVTKPPGENTDVLHKPKEGEAPERQANTRTPQYHFRLNSSPIHQTPGFGVMPRGGGYGRGYGGAAGGPPGNPWTPLLIPGKTHLHDVTMKLQRMDTGFWFISLFALIMQMPVPNMDVYEDADYDTVPISHAYSVDRKLKLQRHKPPVQRPRPTFVSTAAATSAPLLHRFLLKSDSASPPLCFDVNGAALLKLLHHPSRELYVNGELDSVTNGGFKKIVVHFTADQHVEVTTTGVTVRVGQNVTHHTGQDPIAVGSMTVIRRDKEIDVAAADARLVILVHQKNGKELLWPVLRQKPSATNMEGILALSPAVYEAVQQASLTKLKIKDQEISATSATAVDYGVVFPLTMNCWLMSAESALQRRLDDFFVAQL